MRIIAGQARGRKLNTLPGDNTRPTLDRTREALFNILQTRVFDAQVLDLFAGSGALALEALSRGAESAVLCDKSPEACKVIRQNIDAVRVSEKAQLMNCEAQAAAKWVPPWSASFLLIESAISGRIASPLFSVLVGISHLSIKVPSDLKKPHLTVVPPISIPNA